MEIGSLFPRVTHRTPTGPGYPTSEGPHGRTESGSQTDPGSPVLVNHHGPNGRNAPGSIADTWANRSTLSLQWTVPRPFKGKETATRYRGPWRHPAQRAKPDPAGQVPCDPAGTRSRAVQSPGLTGRELLLAGLLVRAPPGRGGESSHCVRRASLTSVNAGRDLSSLDKTLQVQRDSFMLLKVQS